MRSRLAIIAVVVLIAGAAYFLVDWNRTNGVVVPTPASLAIDPQNDEMKVVVQSAQLLKDGYLVVRAAEGTRLGQIVEISDLLPTGHHQNVTIDLGDFYEGGKELIVMIYADNGDRVFNDNDKPYTSENGSITARYVSSGTEVAQSLLKSNSASQGHVMGGAPMPRVRYTNAGFVPKDLTVNVGTMVEFVNESNSPMWVASNEHPEHGLLPTFDQFETVDTSATYTYVFDKSGEWSYHDHINPALEGVILVE